MQPPNTLLTFAYNYAPGALLLTTGLFIAATAPLGVLAFQLGAIGGIVAGGYQCVKNSVHPKTATWAGIKADLKERYQAMKKSPLAMLKVVPDLLIAHAQVLAGGTFMLMTAGAMAYVVGLPLMVLGCATAITVCALSTAAFAAPVISDIKGIFSKKADISTLQTSSDTAPSRKLGSSKAEFTAAANDTAVEPTREKAPSRNFELKA